MNRNLQKTYRKVLYALKKQYGDEIIICRNTSVSTNYTTGEKSYTCIRTRIGKAILLPTNFARKASFGLPAMSANKMFVFGGTFDIGSKIVVVDVRDVPVYFELTQDDWLLIDGVRYEITKIEELEYHAGWVIASQQNCGVKPDREISLEASDTVNTEDTAGRDIDISLTDSTTVSDVVQET